jgi:hypothetical protein
VVLGHGVVVHVRDHHRLRLAGAFTVVDASYLENVPSRKSTNALLLSVSAILDRHHCLLDVRPDTNVPGSRRRIPCRP